MKVAVVTPYYKEPPEKLLRCMASVAAQDYPVEHFMVADGFPCHTIANARVKHLILPSSHGDYGNTPRGIGAISALNSGFEAIAFLDADNWYEPNHISSLVSATRLAGAHVAISGRRIFLPDGTVVPGHDPEDAAGAHADTSTYFISDKAAFLLPVWAMMDPALGPIGDRILLAIIKAEKVPFVRTGLETMNYESNYALHYRMAGRPVPENTNDVDLASVTARYSRERMAARLRTSFSVSVGAKDAVKR